MNAEELREYCLAKKEVTESFPFDDTTLVFKVCNKMFLLISLGETLYFNAKCDPERAIELREKHHFIQPGYHMNKQHWNSVYVDDCFDDKLLLSLIDDSYDLIVDKLPKKIKEKLF
ncbi:MAG: MmcQ/YjbR family DNA-binding protein [Bacteroidia bacterium]|nr:MmcQ/YjbR family DNA-binding protein [Bacteroidia bacterium]